jgi:excisionase family DNA binding protein
MSSKTSQTPLCLTTYTEQQAAKAIGVHPITLSRARTAGTIRFHRIGRRVVYSEQQIRDFLKATERNAFEKRS